jgi:hypothetical protein
MNLELIDKKIAEILEKRNALSNINYDDDRYDQVEEELHNLEDQLIEDFGEYFESVLENVHDEICPNNEILLPTAYLPKITYKNENNEYDFEGKQGVLIDAIGYKGKDTRLVLVPFPTRLILLIGGKEKKVVWRAK